MNEPGPTTILRQLFMILCSQFQTTATHTKFSEGTFQGTRNIPCVPPTSQWYPPGYHLLRVSTRVLRCWAQRMPKACEAESIVTCSLSSTRRTGCLVQLQALPLTRALKCSTKDRRRRLKLKLYLDGLWSISRGELVGYKAYCKLYKG